MHATHHLHIRRAFLAALAALALALAAAAALAAALDEANIGAGAGAGDRSVPSQAPAVAAPATPHGEPAWAANPFAYPLLQVPAK